MQWRQRTFLKELVTAMNGRAARDISNQEAERIVCEALGLDAEASPKPILTSSNRVTIRPMKDYARRAAQHDQKQRKPNRTVWWVLVVVLAFVVGGIAIESKLKHADKSAKPVAKKIVVKKLPVQSPKTKAKTQAPQFEFYTLLPHMKVLVPKGQAKVVAPQAGQYVLQFTSTTDLKGANTLKERLGAMGVDVHVESFPVKGQTWYRVVSAPYNSKATASTVQNNARLQNYDSLLLQVKVSS